MRRALSPSLNPAGLMAAAGAVYAATVMITNAYNGHGIIDPPVIVAAVGAVAALLTRQAVTPVKDPRDGNGTPLAPAVPPDAPFTVAPRLPPNVTVVPQTAADETVTPPGM
jgi:hypothetical protein